MALGSKIAVKGRFVNCGQNCIASKRFIVIRDIVKEFTEKFVQKTEQLKVGDPLADDTDLGPWSICGVSKSFMFLYKRQGQRMWNTIG
jgi:acyl-CoA reductase-like NAD-dependent aldehyde dehydrogenase